MSNSIRATICIFADDDGSKQFKRCLDGVLRHTPLDCVELRLGFGKSAHSFYHALGTLCADGASAEIDMLPGGIERFRWTGKEGCQVRAWVASGGVLRDRMARLLYHDVAMETDYAISLDSSFCVEAGWWEALMPHLEQGADYLGQSTWHDYSMPQLDAIRTHSWYMGIPFERREGRQGVWFVPWGFMAIRSRCLYEANLREFGSSCKGEIAQCCKEDVLLGEMARQLGWKRADHNQYVTLKPA